MAIIFDDKYHKIIKSTTDFENNATEVEMKVYGSQSARDREKCLASSVNVFCKRVQEYLIANVSTLINETNQIQPMDTIINKEEFLLLHPSIRAKAEEYESIQTEGIFLIDKVLKEDIDVTSLKHLDKWRLLGFTEEMSKKIDVIGSASISVDGIRDSSLFALYNAAKEKIVSPVIDC